MGRNPYNHPMTKLALPGADLIEKGIADLRAGAQTIESLLVSQAVTALTEVGYPSAPPLPDPELRLYRLLEESHGDGAHSKYNAYRRQLASFLRAARCVRK